MSHPDIAVTQYRLIDNIKYENLSLIMELQIRGVIFDSAPGERRITALFKAISAIIGGHPLTNLPMSFVITFFLSVLWFFEVNGFVTNM